MLQLISVSELSFCCMNRIFTGTRPAPGGGLQHRSSSTVQEDGSSARRLGQEKPPPGKCFLHRLLIVVGGPMMMVVNDFSGQSNFPCQLKTVSWHHEIEKDTVELLVADSFGSFFAVVFGDHVKPD